MKILGIETSCDETAAAVVELTNDGKSCRLLSNVVASSVDLHIAYGGVVPEIAARSHIESIIPVVEKALDDAFPISKHETLNPKQILNPKSENSALSSLPSALFDPWDQIDGVAVTYGAGLGGSLLIGVMTARTLAIIKKKPLYGINHVEAHLYANFITSIGSLSPALGQSPKHRESFLRDTALQAPLLSRSSISTSSSATHLRLVSHQNPTDVKKFEQQITENGLLNNSVDYNLEPITYNLSRSVPSFPMLGLIVSGGHTQLVLFKDHFKYKLLGQTHDDAIGEAFDKVAKILGLPYPGGPSIAETAQKGNPLAYDFPKARSAINQASHVDAVQGNSEQRTEPYTKYGEGAAQLLTPHGATSNSGATSSDGGQAVALRGLGKYDFSFSGIKTAVLRTAQAEIGEDYAFPSHKLPDRLSEAQKANIAASFQRIAIETIVDKTIMAYEEFKPKSVVIGGGVAANRELREQLAKRLPIAIEFQDIKLMGDNGAMVAALGCYKSSLKQKPADPSNLDISPNLSM